MRNGTKFFGFAGALLLALGALAAAPKAAKPVQKDVVRPAETIQWKDGPVQGTHVADLWGGMDKGGPYGVLIKFDAGLMHALHWHSRDLKIVVLSGTFVHEPKGAAQTRLGPGSYLLQAGGNKHVSGCAPGADCVFFMTSSDKFDMTMVGGAPSGKK